MKIPAQELHAAFEVIDAVEDDAAVETSRFIRLQLNQKTLLLTLTGTLWAEATTKGDTDGKWVAYNSNETGREEIGELTQVEVCTGFQNQVVAAHRRLIGVGGEFDVPVHEIDGSGEEGALDQILAVAAVESVGAQVAEQTGIAAAGLQHVTGLLCFQRDLGRQLQRAVDALFDNEHNEQPLTGAGGRPLRGRCGGRWMTTWRQTGR